MANKHASLDALFTDIADAIREKTGETGTIAAAQIPSVIRESLQVIPPPVPYLTFSSPSSFTITPTRVSWDGILEYSSDTDSWSTWDGTTISSIANGSEYVLYLRGAGNTMINSQTGHKFNITGTDVRCNGNIETLLDYSTVESGNHPTMANYCYYAMFYNCTALTQAPALPATTLAERCYYQMFYGCSNLTQPPSNLPATTLAERCYAYMFEFSGITAIPRIMATTYAVDSCKGMFDDIKTLHVYSSSGTGHTYGWTAPASTYCSGMFGSDDHQSEWAKLDGSNFPNSGTPTEGVTYYFATVD